MYKVYSMLTPKPRPLLTRKRDLVRHGELIYFSPNTMTKKPRYFFLFNDCLLLTKRKKAKKFRLKIFIHLRSNCAVAEGKGASTEFRLLVPHFSKKGRGPAVRPIIMFGQTRAVKDAWVKDLKKCIAALKSGKRGTKIVVHHHHHHNEKGAKDDTMYMGGEESSDDNDYIVDPSSYKDAAARKPTKEDPRPQESSSEEEPLDKHAPTLDPFATPSGEIFDPFNLSGAVSTSSPYDSGGVPLGVDLLPAGGGPDPYASTGGIEPYPGFNAFDPRSASATYPTTALADPSSLSAYSADYATAGMYGMTGVGAAGVSGLSNDFSQLDMRGAAFDAATQLQGMLASEAALREKEEALAREAALRETEAALKREAESAAAALREQEARVKALEAAQAESRIHADSLAAREAALAAKERELMEKERLVREAESARAANVESGATVDNLASKELADATAVIENLVAMLASRPRKASREDGDDSPLNLDDLHDAIVDSAQAIAKASAALLRSASHAQKERIELGLNPATQHLYNPDPVWSNGLISAARYVVGTTQMLVDTANKCADGSEKEEKLVASANAVSVATTQLVTAQTAKSTSAETTKNVESAARGVRSATSLLVKAVGKFRDDLLVEEAIAATPSNPFNLTSAQVAEIEAQSRILALEKETELARKKLQALHKQKYGS